MNTSQVQPEAPASAQPNTRPGFTCVVSWAAAESTKAKEQQREWVVWLSKSQPLLEQFRYARWMEIPQSGQELLARDWSDQLEQRRAQLAIENKVPVSEMRLECGDTPHCFEIEHPDNANLVGLHYQLILEGKYGDVLAAAGVADGRQIDGALRGISEAIRHGIAESILTDAVVAEFSGRATVWHRLHDFYGLLPASAVLPRPVAVHPVEKPTACSEAEWATLPRWDGVAATMAP